MFLQVGRNVGAEAAQVGELAQVELDGRSFGRERLQAGGIGVGQRLALLLQIGAQQFDAFQLFDLLGL